MCSFFFQAEDGIRDDLVTGVQTCALPIYANGSDEGRIQPWPGRSAAVRHGLQVDVRAQRPGGQKEGRRSDLHRPGCVRAGNRGYLHRQVTAILDVKRPPQQRWPFFWKTFTAEDAEDAEEKQERGKANWD